MSSQRREKTHTIVGIAVICLSLLAGISLRGGAGQLGRINLLLRSGLIPYFHMLAWTLPVLGIYWGWKLIVGNGYRRGVMLTLFVVMAFVALSTFSFLSAGRGAAAADNIGGKLGNYAASKITVVFGNMGSRVVVVAGALVLFIVVTGVSLRKGALWIEQGLVKFFKRFHRPKISKPRAMKPSPPRRASKVTAGGAADTKDSAQQEIPLPAPVIPARPHREVEPSDEPVPAIGAAADYVYPQLTLFEQAGSDTAVPEQELRDLASYLENKLGSFGIEARVVEIHPGPVITRFEVEPGSSTKVHQVVNLADDLALALKARSLRILAPIPGKGTIGIEVPNKHPDTVRIREILASTEFTSAESKLALALGKDVSGKPYVADLEAMPHLLIAGATGSGKSVCINTIVTSLVCRNSPQDVQLLLIDPKRLELNMYDGVPHLVCEVVTEAKKAVRALGWVVEEMDLRYQILARRGVRNIQSYEEGLPYIVVIIDELADLMLVVPQEIEFAITKLAQMARAVGIHLVVATQRPSVDVITGVIKANFPCRVAFKVASKTDSRTIIDANGAERLLGKGDMLVLPPGSSEPTRVHGAFVSVAETQRLVQFLRKQSHLASPGLSLESVESREVTMDAKDALFEEAARIVITHQQGSVSLLQRRLKVGYSRAARLIDFLEEAGIVGPFEGSKARQVLVDESYLENLSPER